MNAWPRRDHQHRSNRPTATHAASGRYRRSRVQGPLKILALGIAVGGLATGCGTTVGGPNPSALPPAAFCSAAKVIEGDIDTMTMSPRAGIAAASDVVVEWAAMLHSLVGTASGSLDSATVAVNNAFAPLATAIGRSSLVDLAEDPAAAGLFDAIQQPDVRTAAAVIERKAAVGCGVLTPLGEALNDIEHIRNITSGRAERDKQNATSLTSAP